MAKIQNAGDAHLLAERLFKEWADWHDKLEQWRNLTDRNMEAVLEVFKEILPEKLKAKWRSYQADDVQSEAMQLAALLAANPVEIEAISKSNDRPLLKLAQTLEEADEALLQALMPVEKRLLRYMGILTDGLVVQALDTYQPGPAQQRYAKDDARKKLEEYAGGDEDPDDDDDRPEAVYKRAYKDAGGDHQKAYSRVMLDAAMEDDLPVGVRIVDAALFAAEFDELGNPQIGVERAKITLSACLELLEGYGVKQEGARLVLTPGGETSALTASQGPTDGADGTMSTGAGKEIEYVQIRTADEILISIRGLDEAGSSAGDGDGILIRTPNLFGKSLGYILTIPSPKIRSRIWQKMEPVLRPLMVEVQEFNALYSGASAMAWAEASLEEYELEAEYAVQPVDATGETKSAAAAPGGAKPNVAAGEVKRIPSTGIDIKEMLALSRERIREREIHELFSGTGSSSESGRHLARMQTLGLTLFTPIQAMCSSADKETLLAFHRWVAATGRSIVIAQEPDLGKSTRDGIRVAKPLEITPKMAKLPVSLRVSTGASFPEAEYAAQQMGLLLMDKLVIGVSTFRTEYLHAKDPQHLEKQMIDDQLTAAAIESGKQKLGPLIDQRMQEIVDAIVPPPPPTPPPPPEMLPPADPSMPPGPGSSDPVGAGGGGYLEEPAPVQDGGVPDVAGAGGGMQV